MNNQSGILGPVPKHARYLTFSFEADVTDANEALAPLLDVVDGENTIVGFGPSLVAALNSQVPGLRAFPSMVGPGFDIPSTQYALWFWLRGDDRGELHHRAREIEDALSRDFQMKEVLDGFMHRDSRDLSGYIDGTENPVDEAAINAAVVQGQGSGLDGASFVAVQQWVHDFELLDAMEQDEQDDTIGRRISDNEELSDAPDSAHVKRTAQESFAPEAFMVRRSMPWVEGNEAGLNFVSFVNTLDSFEIMLQRMVGAEDGITDALFNFTRPISGGYYWCPPMKDGKLDLSIVKS
ncbi:MAG TPA: Dyp-type peroxidase [Candidatus Tenderia electrophaga]|uniref:Dyp-type peroxidase n=1 Tax=Candidatus Tenderia electrophaga TaxID=1748243 RepID=A0A832J738_9GAMM|nr:Dyp-type peroxidase [Candidatus Tenderia electrophaga]